MKLDATNTTILDIALKELKQILVKSGYRENFVLYSRNEVVILESESFKMLYSSKYNRGRYTGERVPSGAVQAEISEKACASFKALQNFALSKGREKIEFASDEDVTEARTTRDGFKVSGIKIAETADRESLDEPVYKLVMRTSQPGFKKEMEVKQSEVVQMAAKLASGVKVPGLISISLLTMEGSRVGVASYRYIQKYNGGFVKQQNADWGFEVPEEKPRYLRCLDTQKNQYKFYYMRCENGRCEVEYGRIAEDSYSEYGRNDYSYPVEDFWFKYYEKIEKGYVDFTDVLEGEELNKKAEPKETVKEQYPSQAYEELYNFLYKAASSFVSNNIPNGIRITEKLIIEASSQFSRLVEAASKGVIKDFNKEVERMALLVPRKLRNVKSLYASRKEDMQGILDREEQLLLALQVFLVNKGNKTPESAPTVKTIYKDPMQAIITEPTQDEYDWVCRHVRSYTEGRVYKVYKVAKPDQIERYRKYCEKNKITVEKHLWHGSPTSNWTSIITNNLKCKPDTKTYHGSMFGPGIYFADDSNKSIKYTSMDGSYWEHGTSNMGVLGLYRVAYGDPEICYHSHHYTASELKAKGKNSVHAKKGRDLYNDEYIVYDNDASSIEYVVLFTVK